MHNGLKNTLIFVLGAAVGSVATWKLLKTKYEQIVQDEIDSFKEKMAERTAYTPDSEPEEDVETTIMSSERKEYKKMASMYSANPEEKGDSESEDEEASYITIIPPEDFGESEDYDTESLICYTDGVVTDDRGNVIEDMADTIGEEAIHTFGRYEDDFVYVRNDKYKCEYEIFRDYRKYTDVYVDPCLNLMDEE